MMMFRFSKFNSDISKWNVSNVFNMWEMFSNSPFNQDISAWDVSNVSQYNGIFKKCPIEIDYMPVKFKLKLLIK